MPLRVDGLVVLERAQPVESAALLRQLRIADVEYPDAEGPSHLPEQGECRFVSTIDRGGGAGVRQDLVQGRCQEDFSDGEGNEHADERRAAIGPGPCQGGKRGSAARGEKRGWP